MCTGTAVSTRMATLVAVAKRSPPVWNGNDSTAGCCVTRAGKYEEALEQFEVSGGKGFAFKAWDQAFLAMIHHHLGNKPKAVRSLEQAKLKNVMHEGWWEKSEIDHLIREADNLIMSKHQKNYRRLCNSVYVV